VEDPGVVEEETWEREDVTEEEQRTRQKRKKH